MIRYEQAQEISIKEMKFSPISTSGKIMVVDDQPLSLLHATDLVRYEGYQVMEVSDCHQVLPLAFEHQPDVILMDTVIADMEGLELARKLKLEPHTQSIPIILMSVTEDYQLRHQALTIGVEEIISKPLEQFSLYPKLRNLVQQKRLNEVLNQTQKVLLSLASAIKHRCGYDTLSNFQLANLVVSFGECLHLSRWDLEDLVFAAYLHDIGTVSIPDNILGKKEPLTPEELEIIRQHVIIGEKICQPLHNRPKLLEIIRHHHERYDGSGYPDKLKGDEIPYLAQVFQLADIYYALVNRRAYKEAYGRMESLTIMEEEVNKGWRNIKLWEQFRSFILGYDQQYISSV